MNMKNDCVLNFVEEYLLEQLLRMILFYLILTP